VANSNLTKCFLNLNEDIEHLGGMMGAEVREHMDIESMGIVEISWV
jgi:hypothetical protein